MDTQRVKIIKHDLLGQDDPALVGEVGNARAAQLLVRQHASRAFLFSFEGRGRVIIGYNTLKDIDAAIRKAFAPEPSQVPDSEMENF